jgi:uncharacterized protein (TIGR03067 family)
MRPVLLITLLIAPVFLVRAADRDDRARLQGVWQSPADAPVRARIIFFDGKIGYAVGDVAAKTPKSGSTFVGLSEAKYGESGGKHFADLEIAKDVKRHVEYRFDKDDLVVGLDGKEYRVQRINTRADDPAAKKLAGTWKVTEVEAKGMKATGKNAGLESVAFTGDRYVWKATGGKEALNSLYRLGEFKDGRASLDVFGMKADPALLALVELKGDTLAIAQPLKPSATRPPGFDTAAGDTLVIRATRAK